VCGLVTEGSHDLIIYLPCCYHQLYERNAERLPDRVNPILSGFQKQIVDEHQSRTDPELSLS